MVVQVVHRSDIGKGLTILPAPDHKLEADISSGLEFIGSKIRAKIGTAMRFDVNAALTIDTSDFPVATNPTPATTVIPFYDAAANEMRNMTLAEFLGQGQRYTETSDGTPPANARVGDEWYRRDNAVLHKLVDDGGAAGPQWVDVSTAGGGLGPTDETLTDLAGTVTMRGYQP